MTSLAHLLNSNHPPDELEIPGIQSAIVEAQRRLRSLDYELVELEQTDEYLDDMALAEADYPDAAQNHLLMLRDEQHALVLRLRNTLSALRRLPPEILTVIFSFALPSGEKGVPIDANSVLWRASQVCRMWRQVICEGMQFIWSSIEIDCMKVERHNLTSTLLELALQRSGMRSLTIRFCFSHRNHFGVLSEIEKRCLNLLTAECFRWEQLELDWIPIAVLDSLTAAVKSRMPLLRRLAIENVPFSHAMDTPSSAAAFEIAPQLEHFTLSGYFRPSRFQLPWSQLTSYSGSFRDIKDFLVVLACATNLTTCDVFLRNYHPGFIVEHPNIRTLRMRGVLEGLARLRLPFLQTLIMDELIIQDLAIISVFLRRTPSINVLEVYILHESGADNSLDILSEFMGSSRNVSTLVLMGEVDMRSICSLLNTSDTRVVARILMPRLAHLSLSVLASTNRELAGVLGAMVESRHSPIMKDLEEAWVPLSSLTLHTLRTPTAILERLKPLEDMLGLKVNVEP